MVSYSASGFCDTVFYSEYNRKSLTENSHSVSTICVSTFPQFHMKGNQIQFSKRRVLFGILTADKAWN